MPVLPIAGLAAAAHAASRAIQGPSSGSPFVKAPLPFEEIKAAPDRAFEVVLLTVGVMFLAGLATAAFLVLSKLRSIEEGVLKELRQARETAAERGQGAVSAVPSGAGSEAGTGSEAPLAADAAVARIEEGLQRAASAVEASIDGACQRLVGAAEGGQAGDPDGGGQPAALELSDGASAQLASVVEAMERAAASYERASDQLIDRLRLLEAAPAPAPKDDADPEDPPSGSSSARGLVLDRIHARLTALGFTEIEVVTPREELLGPRLVAGEVSVEARRSGAIHKGTVTLEDGAPVDFQLRPSHSIFP